MLEFWFAYAEHEVVFGDVDLQILETLVRCYRANPTTPHPPFLTRLAEENTTRELTNTKNEVARVENGITYVNPVFHRAGDLSLTELAKAATSR